MWTCQQCIVLAFGFSVIVFVGICKCLPPWMGSSCCWREVGLHQKVSYIGLGEGFRSSALQELKCIADNLRGWSGSILQNLRGEDLQRESAKMQRAVETLDIWADSLAEATGHTAHRIGLRGWRFCTECLLDSIFFSMKLKGGATELKRALQREQQLTGNREHQFTETD